MAVQYELACIGAGNMAEGIVAAVVGKGLYAPGAIAVSDPAPGRRDLFARRFGVTVTDDNRRLAAESRRIILAVKPQAFNEVAAGIADLATGEQLFISIMAGKSARSIAAALTGGASREGIPAGEGARRDSRTSEDGSCSQEGAREDARSESDTRAGESDTRGPSTSEPAAGVRVVRVMPNLPILVGAGMAGICGGAAATARDIADVQAIFNAGGGSVVVPDESLMDAVTAVSGSGPAYFYYFVEAMVEGGKACGLAEADALELAKFTCLGAARMMLETGESPADLRAKVTSKGGTTQAALESMSRAGVDAKIRDAVAAAFNRGRELAG